MTTRPRPVADAVSAFYWEAARRHELAVLVCDACGLAHHPPDVACPHCGSSGLASRAVSGRGRVFASCTARQAFDVAFADAVPYPLVLVALDEHPEVHVLTNVVDDDLGTEPVPIGTAVEVIFEHHDDWVLPQFRLAP